MTDDGQYWSGTVALVMAALALVVASWALGRTFTAEPPEPSAKVVTVIAK